MDRACSKKEGGEVAQDGDYQTWKKTGLETPENMEGRSTKKT